MHTRTAVSPLRDTQHPQGFPALDLLSLARLGHLARRGRGASTDVTRALRTDSTTDIDCIVQVLGTTTRGEIAREGVSHPAPPSGTAAEVSSHFATLEACGSAATRGKIAPVTSRQAPSAGWRSL
ncbi:MAG: hypothetical protein ACKOQ1_00430 [Actinomycetota bacterium]